MNDKGDKSSEKGIYRCIEWERGRSVETGLRWNGSFEGTGRINFVSKFWSSRVKGRDETKRETQIVVKVDVMICIRRNNRTIVQ